MAVSRSDFPVEMSTVSTSELGLGERLEKVSRRESRILVEDDGEPVAVIVSLADFREFQRLEANNLLSSIRAAFSDLNEDEIEAMVDEAIHEVEAEHKHRREQQGS